MHFKEWTNNFLSPLIKTFDEDGDPIILVEKMQSVAMMHNEIIDNVDQAQIKHKHVYALWKGR